MGAVGEERGRMEERGVGLDVDISTFRISFFLNLA
jgi:hypothetical protein